MKLDLLVILLVLLRNVYSQYIVLFRPNANGIGKLFTGSVSA